MMVGEAIKVLSELYDPSDEKLNTSKMVLLLEDTVKRTS